MILPGLVRVPAAWIVIISYGISYALYFVDIVRFTGPMLAGLHPRVAVANGDEARQEPDRHRERGLMLESAEAQNDPAGLAS